MKGMRIWSMVMVLAALSWCKVMAQQQIPNGGFENWSTPPFAQYEEPSGSWWTTLNALSGLGGPVTVEKSSDAHSGNFSARLQSAQWGSLMIPGLLVSGEFDAQNPSFLVQGQPFTDSPEGFQGWFKYAPVGGDSAAIAALLTRWNSGQGRRDTLAIAAAIIPAAQPTWTLFDLPFISLLPGTPDSILVALVSSGDGQNFNGQPGSMLWIDDLSLQYATSAPSPSTEDGIATISCEAGQIRVDMSTVTGQNMAQVWDIQGKLLHTERLHAGQNGWPAPYAAGIYLVTIESGNRPVLRQKIIILRP